MSPLWHLESLTIGPMYHEADLTFWNAALKDFPKLPHLTRVKIIYYYRTPKAFNHSFWYCLGSILSNRDTFPRLEVVDVCPTVRSQRLGYQKIYTILHALRSIQSRDRSSLTFWGETREVVFCSLECVLKSCSYRLVLLLVARSVKPIVASTRNLSRSTLACLCFPITYMNIIHVIPS